MAVTGNPEILLYSRIRKSPFFYASRRHGVAAYSVYNHTYHPRHYGDPVDEYWHLLNGVTLWDTGVERQVEITGPDAFTFTNMLVPRDLTKCQVGQCKYVFITAPDGGIINDPVLLRLGENHFWLALADSDVLLWARGVACHSGFEVEIRAGAGVDGGAARQQRVRPRGTAVVSQSAEPAAGADIGPIARLVECHTEIDLVTRADQVVASTLVVVTGAAHRHVAGRASVPPRIPPD
jgi:hypothetical protein